MLHPLLITNKVGQLNKYFCYCRKTQIFIIFDKKWFINLLLSHFTGDQSDRPVPFYGERTMSYDQSIRLPASSNGEQQRYHR